jgi:hypothetical protein
MHRRPEVMTKTGKRQLKRAYGATSLRLSFEDIDVQALLREDDGSRQSVGARANDTRSPAHREPRKRDGDRPDIVFLILRHDTPVRAIAAFALSVKLRDS